MKKLLILCLLISVLTLSACSTNPKAPTLEGAARDEVLAYADPLAENLLNGMKNGDYQAFSRDMNDKMKGAMDSSKFEDLRKQLGDRIGQYQSREVQSVTDYGDMVTVTYKGAFEKAKNIKILITFTKSEPHQVTGLYFQ